MTVVEQALVRLSQTLSDNGIPYMIIGGMANAVWGEPRATLDIYATVWVRDDQVVTPSDTHTCRLKKEEGSKYWARVIKERAKKEKAKKTTVRQEKTR